MHGVDFLLHVRTKKFIYISGQKNSYISIRLMYIFTFYIANLDIMVNLADTNLGREAPPEEGQALPVFYIVGEMIGVDFLLHIMTLVRVLTSTSEFTRTTVHVVLVSDSSSAARKAIILS
jgi:hypothetical protein